MSSPSAPSVPSVSPPSADLSLKMKLDLLWQTNKPLFIGIIALITLVIFAIIFCIVYFLVIKPHQQSSTPETTTTTTKTAHMLYQGLRSFTHI